MQRKSGVAKLSVSIPAPLAGRLKRRVGTRGVSSFAARAIQHELERDELGGFLAEIDSELGPVDEALLREAREFWQSS